MENRQIIDKLNQNVADLNILFVKLHNYHWNVKGMEFKPIHEMTEAYYDHLNELYDEVAERVLQLGGKPAATVKQYLEMAKISEESQKDFSAKEVLDGVIKDFEYLLDSYRSILAVAQEYNDTATENIAADSIGWFDKELWMLNASRA